MKKVIISSLNFLAILFLYSCQQVATTENPKVSLKSCCAPTSVHDSVELNELKNVQILVAKSIFTPDLSSKKRAKYEEDKNRFLAIEASLENFKDLQEAQSHISKRDLEFYTQNMDVFMNDFMSYDDEGCSWYCGGGPDTIIASSTLKNSGNTSYDIYNLHDFHYGTAWVEGVAGNGIGESITFRFPQNSPPVTTMMIYNGYMKSEQAWQENGRVKQFKMYVNDQLFAMIQLRDNRSYQQIEFKPLQNKKGPLFIKLVIDEVYPGTKYEDVAITDINFDGIGVHCFAAGTMVETPQGKQKIEDLRVGSTVLSFNEKTKKLESDVVLELANAKHHNLVKIQLGSTRIEVTDDHPFFHEGFYYAVKANNLYGVDAKLLKVGQYLSVFENGKLVQKKVEQIKNISTCQETYTITKLMKNKLFLANGILVATEEYTLIQ